MDTKPAGRAIATISVGGLSALITAAPTERGTEILASLPLTKLENGEPVTTVIDLSITQLLILRELADVVIREFGTQVAPVPESHATGKDTP